VSLTCFPFSTSQGQGIFGTWGVEMRTGGSLFPETSPEETSLLQTVFLAGSCHRWPAQVLFQLANPPRSRRCPAGLSGGLM
jgi:hypothetical protein